VSGTYAHPGVFFVVVLAISMTPKLFMALVVLLVGLKVCSGMDAAKFGSFAPSLDPLPAPGRGTLSNVDYAP
jgi:hypothetical protein